MHNSTFYIQSKRRHGVFVFVVAGLVLVGMYLFVQSQGTADIPADKPDTEVLTQNTVFIDKTPDIKLNTDPSFDELKKLLEARGDKYSLYIENITTKTGYAYNEHDQMYAASLYKVPVALAVLQKVQTGTLRLEDQITYEESDLSDGTGQIYKLKYGTKITVKDLLGYLLDQSDNVAQKMLLKRVDLNVVFNVIAQNVDKPSTSKLAVENITTSYEFASLLRNVYLSTPLKAEYKEVLFDEMAHTDFDTYITQGLASELVFSHKIGIWPETSSWHDCGLVFKGDDYLETIDVMVVCLMSRDTTNKDFLLVAKEVGEFVSALSNVTN